MKKRNKEYWEMTTAELREATREFDREMPGIPGKPLTVADRRLLAESRKGGRPKIGLGAEKIRVSIERELLHRTDVAAKRLKMTRSQLIAQGLKSVLKKAG